MRNILLDLALHMRVSTCLGSEWIERQDWVCPDPQVSSYLKSTQTFLVKGGVLKSFSQSNSELTSSMFLLFQQHVNHISLLTMRQYTRDNTRQDGRWCDKCIQQTLLDSCLSWKDSAALCVGVKSLPLKKVFLCSQLLLWWYSFSVKDKAKGKSNVESYMRRLRRRRECKRESSHEYKKRRSFRIRNVM